MPVSLVTGGAGFLGSHVVDDLIARGHDVVVLDDLSGGFAENVDSRAELVRASVVDAAQVDALFERRQFDFVFHLAAYAAENLSHFIRRFNYTNNLIGTVNLINASVNVGSVKCFVFTSSVAVYGTNQVPFDEDLVPSPMDPYGIAKLAIELDLRAAHAMFGLPYVVFRPLTVYGERQNIGDRYRNVVGIFMNNAMRGEPFTVFGDGEQRRCFTYVRDVAPIISSVVEKPETWNTAYNLASNAPTTVNHLAEVVAEAMAVPLQFRHLPPRHEVVDAIPSVDKAKRVLGLRATPLAEGVRRMAEWARAHGPRETAPFAAIEVARNMPPSWAALLAEPKAGTETLVRR